MTKSVFVLAGLSKFAKLARSVTRSRSVLVSQFSSHLPNLKDAGKQSHLAHVRSTLDLAPVSYTLFKYHTTACGMHLYTFFWLTV